MSVRLDRQQVCRFILSAAVLTLGSAAAGCDPGEGIAGPGLGTIPVPALYGIQIQGRADFGGAPGQSWTVPATLVFIPTEDPGAATNNGVNPLEVGIFTHASPIVGVAGALNYATNTALTAFVGGSIGSSALDLAFVNVDARNGRIHVRVDGDAFGLPNARLGTLNIYNVTSGLTAQVHHVLAGEIEIQVAQGGQQVSGRIALGGSSGFGGPQVSSAYLAEFTGVRLD